MIYFEIHETRDGVCMSLERPGNDRKLVRLSLWTEFVSTCGQNSFQLERYRPSAFYGRGGPAIEVIGLGPTTVKRKGVYA